MVWADAGGFCARAALATHTPTNAREAARKAIPEFSCVRTAEAAVLCPEGANRAAIVRSPERTREHHVGIRLDGEDLAHPNRGLKRLQAQRKADAIEEDHAFVRRIVGHRGLGGGARRCGPGAPA